MFDNWDVGLLKVQNPINRVDNFCTSTKRLKKFVDDSLNKLDFIPVIILLACNEVIIEYEQSTNTSFWDIQDIENKLYQIVSQENFEAVELFLFIKEILS